MLKDMLLVLFELKMVMVGGLVAAAVSAWVVENMYMKVNG